MGSIISIIIIVLAIVFGSIQSRRKRVANTTDVPPPQGQMPQHAQTVSRQIENWRRSRRKTANQVEINKKTPVIDTPDPASRKQDAQPSAQQHDEDNKPERKFNLRDAVIYSEIMKTKFDE